MITEKELDEVLDIIWTASTGSKVDYKIECKQRLRAKGLLEQSALTNAREIYEKWKKNEGSFNEYTRTKFMEDNGYIMKMKDLYEQAIKELQEKE